MKFSSQHLKKFPDKYFNNNIVNWSNPWTIRTLDINRWDNNSATKLISFISLRKEMTDNYMNILVKTVSHTKLESVDALGISYLNKLLLYIYLMILKNCISNTYHYFQKETT